MQFKPFKIGKYLLLERLATGGMAEVYRAKASGAGGFEKQLAIKRIIPTYSENEEFRRMFEYEARLSSLLNHANIVHVYDFVKSGDTYLLAMEFVDGKNLRQVVNKAKKTNTIIPIGFSVFVINEVCKGLDYAHKMRDGYQGKHLNVIHRDMSPQNIMLAYEGAIKIVDFGIAKARDRVDETRSGVIKGKFGYMSPEQASGEEIDHRSDIFSTVIILYELITGKRLFAAENDMATLKRIQECIIQRPSLVNPKVNDILEKIILKGLTKEKDLRYQQAGELHQKLQEYLNKFHPTITQNTVSQMMSNLFFQEIKQEKKRLEQVYQESIPYSQGEGSKPAKDEIEGIGQLLDGELTKSEMNPDSLVTKVSHSGSDLADLETNNPDPEVAQAGTEAFRTPGEDLAAEDDEKEKSRSEKKSLSIVTPDQAEAPSVSRSITPSIVDPEKSASQTLKADKEKPPEERTFVPSIELPFHPSNTNNTSASQEKTAFAPSVQDELFTNSVSVPVAASDSSPSATKPMELEKDKEKESEKENSQPSYHRPEEKSSFGHGTKSFTMVTEAKRSKAREPDLSIKANESITEAATANEPKKDLATQAESTSTSTSAGKVDSSAPKNTSSYSKPIPPRPRSSRRPVQQNTSVVRSLATLVIIAALIGTLYIYFVTPESNEPEIFETARSTSTIAPNPAPPVVESNGPCPLRIDSEPKGAEIRINNRIVGRTPLVGVARCKEFTNIQLSLNGYITIEENLRIERPNQTYSKRLRKVAKGRVQVTLSHSATLYVNGVLQNIIITGGKPFVISLDAGKRTRLQFVNQTLKLSATKDYQVSSNQMLRDRVVLTRSGVSSRARQPSNRKRR